MEELQLTEDERVRQLEEQYQAHGTYIDGGPELLAAFDLIEQKGIKHFLHRQHLFRILYRLTTHTSPPTQKKPPVEQKPPPPLKDNPWQPISLPLIEHPIHDTGGESGM